MYRFSRADADAERCRLRQRIARKYQIRDTILSIGQLRLPFTRIADPDVVLTAAAEAEHRAEQHEPSLLPSPRVPGEGEKRRSRSSDAVRDSPLHLPYWAELWESSIGVAQYLLRDDAEHLQGLSVLDLGCGMGLCGCVAGGLGARILFADFEADALLFSRLNALTPRRWNARKPSPLPSPGVPGEEEKRHAASIRTRRLDWGRDRLNERFDLILGGDILYERSQWEALESFWRDHLAAGGRVILAEPGRQTGEQFPAWIACRNWRLKQDSESVSTRPVPIRIFEFSRE